MDACAQCKFFKELLDTTDIRPNAQASEPTDHIVITQDGGIGPGIGECQVAKMIVRKNDAACTDGRPRSAPTATDNQRIIEKEEEKMENKEKDEKGESVDELILKSQIEDLNIQVLELKKANNEEITDHVKTKQALAGAEDKTARLTKELAVMQKKIERLEKERVSLTEDLNQTNNTKVRLEVESDSLKQDLEFYKNELGRTKDKQEQTNKALIETKDDLQRAQTKANDESAEKAAAVQRALNAEEEKSYLAKDNAILSEKIADLTRQLSDGAEARRDLAKRMMKDNQTIKELREDKEKLVTELRDVKRKLSKLDKVRKIKVKV